MANPQITNPNGTTPPNLGNPTYHITDSDRAVADLTLDIGIASPKQFSVQYPSAAAGVQVTLVRGAVSLNLLPGPINDSSTFSNRQIVAGTITSGSDIILTCQISAIAAAGSEAWEVRVSGLAGNLCRFSQPENDPSALTITRLTCDPVAEFTIGSPGSTAKEQQTVTLTASAGIGPNTIVGGPAPTTRYRWTYTGNIAVPAFPACGSSQVMSFTTPGVYGDKTIQLNLQVWLDGACPADVGFLHASAPAQALTIQPRTQHLMLVLDRSGSMAGAKWANAQIAGRILANLFAALRSGVNPADRVGILVFEDTTCTWHTPPIDPRIAPVLPLKDTATAYGDICNLEFGHAGSCTPIGDGMIKAMDDLAGLGWADDPRFTIILLTDGYENSGTVKVSPETPAPSFVPTFASAQTATEGRQQVQARWSVYTIGVGSAADVDEDVLDALPAAGGSPAPGYYRLVSDIDELEEAIGQMVSDSQEAEHEDLLPGGPSIADPSPLAHQRYFTLDPKVNRLAVTVNWTNPSDTIELARRNSGDSGAFLPVSVAVQKCPRHGFTWVDVAALYGGEDNVPATEWRVVHKSGDVPQPIPDEKLMIFVDLFVKAEIRFDKDRYRTGDPMHITARLRAGNRPITKARVLVELARPGESLGTFLVTHGANYRPGDSGPSDQARPHPKQAMLQDLLRKLQWKALPVLKPTAVFDDGSNRLFDDGAHGDGAAGDGNFANTYSDTDMEGTYTWRFRIQGELPDGTPFNRVRTISKWVSVNVDPFSSPVTAVFGQPGPHGLLSARITVVPRDRGGQFLGPFRSSEVEFIATAGSLDVPTEPRYDGAYSCKLVYRKGEKPAVMVIVQGKALPLKYGSEGPGQPVRFKPGVTVRTKDPKLLIAADPQQPIPKGKWRFRLEVIDDSGNRSEPDHAVVHVRDTRRPVAVIKAPSQVELGEAFLLDASDSYDIPPGRVAWYCWTLLEQDDKSDQAGDADDRDC